MLGKLFKHEWMASIRVYGLLYILTAVYTLMVIVYSGVYDNFLQKVLSGWLLGFSDTLAVILLIGYFLILLAVNILTLVYLVYRFYQTMVADEGYLTHTLPVTTGQLITVKMVTALIFQLISVIVTILSFFIVIVANGAWPEISSGIGEIWNELQHQGIFCGNFAIWTILAIFVSIAAAIFNILTYYTCISAGNLFNGHKLVGSVVVYIVFNIVLEVISVIIALIGMWVVEKHVGYITNKQSDLQAWISSLQPSAVLGFINIYMVAGLVIMIAGCVILFFVSRYLLKNRLNLA